MPGGAEWNYDHDSAGNLTSINDPVGGQTPFDYDALNRLTGSTDPRESTWTYAWLWPTT